MYFLVALALLQTTPPASTSEADRVTAYVEAIRVADEALVADDPIRARQGFERAIELSPQSPTAAYGLACAAARAGDRDAALVWFTRAVDLGWVDADVAAWDPDLEAFREDPDFLVQVERIRGPSDATPVLDTHRRWRVLNCRTCTGQVRRATMTPDDRHVIPGYEDGRILLLDAETGVVQRELGSMDSGVWELAVSPDGSTLATVSSGGNLGLRSLVADSPGRTVVAFRPEDPSGYPGLALSWSPSSDRLVVLEAFGHGSLWTSKGERLAEWEQSIPYWRPQAAWTPHGESIVLATPEEIHLRDGYTGALTGRAIRQPGTLYGLALSRDGTRVATGLADGVVVIWDLSSGAELIQRRSTYVAEWDNGLSPWPEERMVLALAFSPDSDRLAYTMISATSLCAEVIEVIDTRSGELLWQTRSVGNRWEVRIPTWSANGKRVWIAREHEGGWLSTALPASGWQSELAEGTVPVFGRKRGVLVASGGLTVVDPDSARMLWRRVEVPGGALIQAPSGHFTGTWTSLKGISTTERHGVDNPALDWSRIERLFNPKLVRAAQAGVEVITPHL